MDQARTTEGTEEKQKTYARVIAETVAMLNRDVKLVNFDRPETDRKKRHTLPPRTDQPVIPLQIGFPKPVITKAHSEAQELEKINAFCDSEFGPIGQRSHNLELVPYMERTMAFIVSHENLDPQLRQHVEFLFNTANCIVLENLALAETNDLLNQKVRDLAKEFLIQDIQRATFRL